MSTPKPNPPCQSQSKESTTSRKPGKAKASHRKRIEQYWDDRLLRQHLEDAIFHTDDIGALIK